MGKRSRLDGREREAARRARERAERTSAADLPVSPPHGAAPNSAHMSRASKGAALEERRQQLRRRADEVARPLKSEDPITRLRGVQAGRAMLDQVEVEAVSDLRQRGASWVDIGSLLGVTGQAVSQRFGSRI